jgi:hypothetical protein
MSKLRHGQLSNWIAFVSFATIFLNQASAPAQTDSAAKPAPHPVVKLQLQFKNQQSQFHIGELVPVELVFSSPEHNKVGFYEDCMGHGTYKFQVTPDGFVDRALERNAAGFGEGRGMGCHGWQPEQKDLAEKPYIINLDLNSWFRMEASGHYKISVIVMRTGFPITSDSVDLEILPRDPFWEKEELARIDSMMDTSANEKRPEGCTRLSYLDTRDAELDMARHYRGFDYCDQDLYSALINARYRKPVLDELEAGLAQPDRPIRAGYLGMLAKVALYQEHPDWYPVPLAKSAHADPNADVPLASKSMLWQTPGAIQREEFRYAELLVSALPHKTGEARAISVKSLFDLDQELMGEEVPAEIIEAAKNLAPQVFSALPYDDQEKLLQRDWFTINSPAMIPVLEQIAKQDAKYSHRLALRRLVQIAPDIARPIILEKLRDNKESYAYDELGLLPDKELPEMDAIFLDHLRQALPHGYRNFLDQSALLARYASPAIAGDLKQLVQGQINTMDGQSAAYLIAYFLRADPPVGKDMLHDRLAQPARGNFQFLQYLAAATSAPQVEQAALNALDSPNPQMVSDAFRVLQRYGSINSKPVLLNHFRDWNKKWKSHPEAFQTRGNPSPIYDEQHFLEALTSPQMWLASPEEIAALANLCITKECKQRAEQLAELAKQSPVEIDVDEPGFEDEIGNEFSVGHHGNIVGIDQLKQKLAQYPKGTAFIARSEFGGYAQLQNVYDVLRPWAGMHGFELRLEQRKQGNMIIGSMF